MRETETYMKGAKDYHVLYRKDRPGSEGKRDTTEWVRCDRVEVSDGIVQFIGPGDVHLFGVPTDDLVRYELRKEHENEQ